MRMAIGPALAALVVVTGTASMPLASAERAPSRRPAVSRPVADAGERAREKALRDGWPDTPAGIVAAGWVEAFGHGEQAMRTWLGAHIAPDALKERPLDARIETYRELHARFGDLMLASVQASAPHELTVVLVTEDAARHRFRFRVAPEPPHPLIQVGLLQHDHGHGHGGGRGSH